MFYLPYFLLYSRFDWTRRYFLRRRQKLTTLCPQQQHVILLTKDQLTFFGSDEPTVSWLLESFYGLERQFVNELLHDSFVHDVNDIYGSILTYM